MIMKKQNLDYWSMTKTEQLNFLLWAQDNSFMMETLSEYEAEDRFNDFLDDLYPTCNVACYEYTTSETLKNVDPTAYRCGLADYLSEYYVEMICPNTGHVNYMNKDDYDTLMNDYEEYLESLEDSQEA